MLRNRIQHVYWELVQQQQKEVVLPGQYEGCIGVVGASAGGAPLDGVDLFAVGLQVVHALVLLHAPDLKQAPSALQAAAISQSMDRSYKTFTQAVTLGQEIKSEITELTGVSLNDLGHGELYCREDTDLTGVKVNDVTGKTQNWLGSLLTTWVMANYAARKTLTWSGSWWTMLQGRRRTGRGLP